MDGDEEPSYGELLENITDLQRQLDKTRNDTENSQSTVVAPQQQTFHLDNADDDDDAVPRSRGGGALRARPGHFVVLRPFLGEIKIFDVTTVKDLVMNVDENGQPSFVFKVLNALFWFDFK